MEKSGSTATGLQYSNVLGRKIRKDPWPELGISTWNKLKEALEKEDYDSALELAKYLGPEYKGMHDLFCDWMYADFDFVLQGSRQNSG